MQGPSWFEHVDLMQVVIVVLLSYVAWTIRGFVSRVNRTHSLMQKMIKVIVMLVAEHKKNHECSSVDIEALMREGD